MGMEASLTLEASALRLVQAGLPDTKSAKTGALLGPPASSLISVHAERKGSLSFLTQPFYPAPSPLVCK